MEFKIHNFISNFSLVFTYGIITYYFIQSRISQFHLYLIFFQIYIYNFIFWLFIIDRITIYSSRIKLISHLKNQKSNSDFFLLKNEWKNCILHIFWFYFEKKHGISTRIVRISNLYPVYSTKRITRMYISVTEIVKSE